MYRYVNRTKAPLILPNPRGGSHYFKVNEGTTNPWYSRFVGESMLTQETLDGKPVAHASRPAIVDQRPRTNRKIRDSELIVPPVRVSGTTPGRPGGAPPAPASRSSRPVPTELLSHGCQVACEHAAQAIVPADHHVQFGAMFHCRYCEFHTPDLDFMRGHTAAYHAPVAEAQPTIEPAPPPPPEPIPEIVEVVTSHVAVGLAPDIPTDDVPPAAPSAPAEGAASEPAPEPAPEPPVARSPAADTVPTTEAAAAPTCPVCGKVFGTDKGLRMHQMRTGH